jgi:hypothetical protein
LQVWRRARVQGSDVWLVDYGNHANQNRTAQKTFDFSSIPLGSDIDFSFWLLSRGELASNGIYYDYFQVEVNGNLVLGPLVNITTWTLQNIDLSTYAGNSSVTVLFRWVNDGSVANQPAARIDNIKIEYTEPNALPVSLTSFTTECDNGIPLLKWTTASEQNSDYFQIERSRDGIDWTPVSKIQGIGNSNTTKNYQFHDMTTGGNFEGYYRLKQVDIDGKFEYFYPKYILCGSKTYDIEVFPNPVKEELFTGIRNSMLGEGLITITDFSGKVVKQEWVNLSDGYNLISLDVKYLSSGIYLIKIISNDIKFVGKFVKN